MPVTIIPKNVRTILHFGEGDIYICPAKMHPDNGGFPLVIFQESEPHEIGAMTDRTGEFCDDFAVGMTFSRPESIDAVINVLTEFKDKQFPTTQPQSNE